MEIIKPHDLFLKNDLSYGSIQHLIKQIDSRSGIQNPWYLDDPTSVPCVADPVNTVFFGNYLKRFLESGLWTNKSYKFWVLSNPIKEVFVRAFGFDASEASVIDRYKLFPAAALKRKEFNLQKSQDWIYAGRLSASKKILTLLSTVQVLQEKFDCPIQLHVYGDYIEDEVQMLSPMTQEGLKQSILSFIENSKWKLKPILYGFVPESDWLLKKYQNPCYVSFSQFPYEDFAVSAALAEQQGWNLLLSHWGGHCNVQTAHFVSPQFLGSQYELSGIEILKGHAIAESLMLPSGDLNQSTFTEQLEPQEISLERIDLLRRQFLSRYGGHMKFVMTNLKALAAYESNGLEYFDLEERCMAMDFAPRKFISIIADKRSDSLLNPLNKEEILSALNKGFELKTFYVQNLASKAQFQKVMKSEKIYKACSLNENSRIERLLSSLTV